jgi:hypothetical protein
VTGRASVVIGIESFLGLQLEAIVPDQRRRWSPGVKEMTERFKMLSSSSWHVVSQDLSVAIR